MLSFSRAFNIQRAAILASAFEVVQKEIHSFWSRSVMQSEELFSAVLVCCWKGSVSSASLRVPFQCYQTSTGGLKGFYYIHCHLLWCSEPAGRA